MAAVVGGTASELGGGKFANGAVTGAFVHMYNAMGHTYPSKKEMIDGSNTQEQGRVRRALNMLSRSERAGVRGISSLSYSEAYSRVMGIERMNDNIGRGLISGAVGLLLAPFVEAGYTYTMVNPVSSYNFAVAALDGGYSAQALGLFTWGGRIGQGISWLLK